MLLPPCVLTRANASITWRGVNHAVDSLDLDNLCELAARLKMITLVDVPDTARVNDRLKRFVMTTLPQNIFYAPMGCNVHLVQRVLANGCDMKKLAGDAYAVHVVTRHPSHALKLMRAARRLADEALVLAGTPADAGCRVHAEAVMSHCMLRVMDHTQGSLVKLPVVDEVVAGEKVESDVPSDARRHGVATLLKFLNGEWSSRRLIHHCNGCCSSEQEAKNNLYAAICQSGLLSGFTSTTPSVEMGFQHRGAR